MAESGAITANPTAGSGAALASKGNIEAIYPLSPLQQGILFHTLYAPSAGFYLMQQDWELHGKLDRASFRQAWHHVINRHAALRTCFLADRRDKPLQVVNRQVQVPWQEYDWRAWSPEEQKIRFKSFFREDRRSGFELEHAPLMRLTFIQTENETYHLIWSRHHLIVDGWSTSLITSQVLDAYQALATRQALDNDSAPSYRDYINWIGHQDKEAAHHFWERELAGFTAPTRLGIDRNPLAVSLPTEEREYREQSFKLSPNLAAALESLARHNRLTLNTIMQGAWAILASRYSGELDVLFGATVSGRPPELQGVEQTVGLFINTLPVRARIRPCDSALAWLGDFQERQLEMRRYEYSALSDVQQWSEMPRGQSLFDTIVVFENYPRRFHLPVRRADIELTALGVQEQTHYPLTLTIIAGERPRFNFGYDPAHFDDDAVARMAGHFRHLLESIVAHPETPLADLQLLNPEELHRILVEWNQSALHYPAACVHHLIQAQARRTPKAVAVVHQDQTITFQELDARANQLAHYLIERGVKPETPVGLSVERSIDLVVGLLGILKAGAAYLPLDPAYPHDRIALMLNDCAAQLLLTQQNLLGMLPTATVQTICLDADWPTIAQHSAEAPAIEVSPDNLAYVIYTSGSTGSPKGVLVRHASVANYTQAAIDAFPLTSSDRVLQFASISFDTSAEEMMPALASGATLVLRDDAMLATPAVFFSTCEKWRISVVDLPTAYWHELALGLDESLSIPDALRLVIIGGEKARPELVARWKSKVSPRVRLVNTYGATEATIISTLADLTELDDSSEPEGSVPIGRPIAGIQAYVLDSALRPVPVGVPGELYIAGAGLARGYLKLPELTARRFIPNPFEPEGQTGARLYWTGDMVRYRPDGNIEFLDRLDDQVKIRGLRIEPGEIEMLLAEHPGVASCAVIARGEMANRQLVAYVVAKREAVLSVHDLQNWLRVKLPAFMVPAAFVFLSAWPLNPSGKIDRGALPAPSSPVAAAGRTSTPPRTPTEKILSNLWREILGVPQVGADDDFFELGGHSLLATRLILSIRDLFQVELPLRSLFQAPTIEALARVIDNGGRIESTPGAAATRALDLEAEAVLDPAIARPAHHSSVPQKPGRILLTGATGFVGAFLLAELLQKTDADVYCLVRAADEEQARIRVRAELELLEVWQEQFAPRIIPITGDLEQPGLGLTTQQFQTLAEQIDSIYHCGALVSFAYPYSRCKPANVLGTREVLYLASKRAIPVHYISTVGVLSPSYRNGELIVEAQAPAHGNELQNGYSQSKWVAEHLALTAARRGLPVSIYRLGSIAGHGQTGAWNRNDYTARFLQGCIQFGSLPDEDRTLNLAPVDYVSQAVVHLSLGQATGKVFHLVAPRRIHMRQIGDWLCAFGYPLQIVPHAEWLSQVIQSATRSQAQALYPILPLLMRNGDRPRIDPQYDCRNTVDGLSGSGIICPDMDYVLLSRSLAYFARHGFLKPPSGKRHS